MISLVVGGKRGGGVSGNTIHRWCVTSEEEVSPYGERQTTGEEIRLARPSVGGLRLCRRRRWRSFFLSRHDLKYTHSHLSETFDLLIVAPLPRLPLLQAVVVVHPKPQLWRSSNLVLSIFRRDVVVEIAVTFEGTGTSLGNKISLAYRGSERFLWMFSFRPKSLKLFFIKADQASWSISATN